MAFKAALPPGQFVIMVAVLVFPAPTALEAPQPAASSGAKIALVRPAPIHHAAEVASVGAASR